MRKDKGKSPPRRSLNAAKRFRGTIYLHNDSKPNHFSAGKIAACRSGQGFAQDEGDKGLSWGARPTMPDLLTLYFAFYKVSGRVARGIP